MGLQTRLMHPDLIREYIATWQQEMQTERREALAARGEQERRLTKVRRDIENIVTGDHRGHVSSEHEGQDGCAGGGTGRTGGKAGRPA